MVKVLPVLVGP